ncbi:ATP-dependent DNA helicase DinG [Sulfurivirga caldicuralii]|uniref:DNA 5'-3' helicase n=1 Tax=Sulfurivirga caldicuralii TaxID=364032 RepID=A0A1N6E152_9GAMM|nr:ATP-dependent DNA helicase [Sulfurivirga caldicuralii]SIN76711.1 ATP-dependent DNA helicase DinG [Sulfurivirga caldicuralii]
MSRLEQHVDRYFSSASPLMEVVEGFQPRPGQQQMAQAVAKAITARGTLVVEAGTGTGKTFAYLVPALLSGKKILISTATKNLQEQLTARDLPRLMAQLAPRGQVLQLKGRENYVCQQRLLLAERNPDLPRAQLHAIAQIRTWLSSGGDGDRAHCEHVPEDDPAWRHVCARAEFCQAARCGDDEGDGCIVPRLRREAQSARVVVVNHHLLAADMALRAQGKGALLPEFDVYVIDEAHQLPETMQQFFGEQCSSAQFVQLLKDARQAGTEDAPDDNVLSEQLDALEDALLSFQSSLSRFEGRWALRERRAEITALMEALEAPLEQLCDHLEAIAPRSVQLQAAAQSAQTLLDALRHWRGAEDGHAVAWAEVQSNWWRLYLTPLSISGDFSNIKAQLEGAWIFTSATLADHHGFTSFCRKLGLGEVDTLKVDSPFDHATQGLIYHPEQLPEPNRPDYTRQCLRRAWPVLEAAQGHALLLFSSFRALNEAAELLRPHWKGTVLVQGEDSKAQLLERFRAARRPLLLATASFWEGVDIPGDDLRVVLIDKIPFASPDDPVLQAQDTRLKEEGKSGFALLQLPRATLALKQGVGRLIRTETDHGVLILCDPRLTSRSYGTTILNQLPRFAWTQDGRVAAAFLKQNFASEG